MSIKNKAIRTSKKVITIFVALTMVTWSLGGLFTTIQTVRAASGYNISYIDDGGVPDIFLSDANVAELCLAIEASESVGASNTITGITLEIMDAMGMGSTMTGFTKTDLSEVALYIDTDGSGSFDSSSDTFLASSSPGGWTALSDPTRWTHTFDLSGNNVVIPGTYILNSQNTVMVIAKASAATIAGDSIKSFNFQISTGGVTVSVDSGASLTNFPAEGGPMGSSYFSMPINIGAEGTGGYGSPILISEIQTTGGGAGGVNDDFVELYNRSPATMDLTGYTLLFYPSTATDLLPGSATASTTITHETVSTTTTIPANGFFLFGNASYDGATSTDLDYNFDIEDSGIVLLAGPAGSAVDWVGYGTLDHTSDVAEGGQAAPSVDTEHHSLERKAFPDSTYTKMNTGGIHASQGNGEDTQNNAMDFIDRMTSNPQGTNSTIEASGGDMTGDDTPIVINEVFYNTTAGNGWIELYNRDTANPTQDIHGWTLTVNGTYTILDTTVTQNIPSGSFITVYWDKVGTDSIATSTSMDLYTGASLADMGAYGGDVILKDGASVIKDYVQYGGAGQANESAANTNGEWMAGDYVNGVLYGQSIGRRSISGDDYNGSSDWQMYASPSAGYPNMGGDSTAPNNVNSVVLTDGDEVEGSGLNGNDITVTWTPNPTPDYSFDKYALYLLPSATALDTDSHNSIEQIYGGQYIYDSSGTASTTYSYTGASFITKDSNADDLVNSASYIAYVIAVDMAGNKSSAAMSATTQLIEEVYSSASDNQAPYIMHRGVWQAKAGQNIVLTARFEDDRPLGDNVPQVVWQAGDDNSPPTDLSSGVTATNCVVVESNYYTCTIPWGGWNSTSIIGYYLTVQDDNTNNSYLGNDFSANTLSAAQSGPILIDILAATEDDFGDYTGNGTADLSGVVYQSEGTFFATNEQPYIFIEGMALAPIQATNSTGAFEFADGSLLAGSYQLVAFKTDYMDMMQDFFRDDIVSVYLNSGLMDYGGGGGEMPFISWTGPNDGMNNVSTDIYCAGNCDGTFTSGDMPVVISFSKEMNPNTINDQDAANSGSNIYLTTDGNDRVSGKVQYVYSSGVNEARFYAATHSTLTPGAFYTIVVTQGVTDTNGNPIGGGAGVGGAFVSGFTTMFDNSDMWGTGWQEYTEVGGDYYGDTMDIGGEGYMGMDFSDYGQTGMMMPPYVKGTVPAAGAFNVSRNTALSIEFSEAMDSTSISTDSIKLYRVIDETAWTLNPTAVVTTLSLDKSSQTVVTLTPTDDLDLNASQSGWYVLKVMGSVKSAMGVWLGSPGDAGIQNPDTYLLTHSAYESSFQLNSTIGGDTADPTVIGTYPNDDDGITSDATRIDVGVPSMEIAFSEPMLPSTINAQNITLKAGSTSVLGSVRYDSTANSAKFMPNSALSANTQYTLTITTNVQDLAGRSLAVAHSVNFKTGGADVTGPEIVYANADDYSMAITFSEPMNSAKQTDTTRWGTSALNPANYYVKSLANSVAVAPYNETNGNRLSTVSNLTFKYDGPTNTVTIDGFGFHSQEPHATDYQIFVDSVIDKSNNIITNTGGRVVSGANATQGPVQSSGDTYGMLGPGGPGMMMMGPMGGGGPIGGPSGGSTGPGMDMGMMGMMQAGAMPMNMMAGQTSMYMVSLPITKQIPSGGKIILTFPAGFNISSAQQDVYSFMNDDFNEWATGNPTFACTGAITDTKCGSGASEVSGDGAGDTTTKGGLADDGVVVNTSAKTVTIHTHGATLATDFLGFDLKGIVNSSVPKEFGTDGYTVDIKTMNADGVLLENISTMPFYLNQGGALTISGTVSIKAGNNSALIPANGQTLTIYLGSPMTGPMETDITFDGSSSSGTYSFSSLSAGEYHFFTEPNITLTIGETAYEFEGIMMPEPMWITASETKDLNVTKMDADSGTEVTISLTGDFTTDSVADDVDIFASSPSGFRVKTLSSVGDVTDSTSVLYLSDGHWMIGIGPAMPKGSMSGPPKMPDWMPPMSIDVNISSGIISETSGTADDDIIEFSISGQSKQDILGQVVDGSNVGIANAEVWASNPMGGFGGSNTKTDASGNFTLKVSNLGFYQVSAHKQGLPESQGKTIDVRAGGVYLGETKITTNSDFQIKIKKPAYTISGKVLNSNSKAVAYAPVWAYQITGWGHAETMTDSSGNYILYVDNGAWIIETDAMGVGWIQYDLSVVINGASQSNINLKPSTDEVWVDISGNVNISSIQQYMPIRAVEYDVNGNYLGREYNSMTDSSGDYTITVKGIASGSRYYRVDLWTPDYGEVERTTDDVDNSPARKQASWRQARLTSSLSRG